MGALTPHRDDGYAPIRDYAMLSDQRTAALVAADGSVDWMCLPRFDGEPAFGALLDPHGGGRFELRPTEPFEVSRRYIPDTNVLETTFETASGAVRVTDALTMGDHRQPWIELVRRVACVGGEVQMQWGVEPRIGWERAMPDAGRLGETPALFCGEHTLAVRSWDAGEPRVAGGAVRGRWTARSGESALLALVSCEQRPVLLDARDRVEARLEQTVAAWRRWLGGCSYDGPWAEQVRRSLLALGACMHATTGAFVAAPTTSLPEALGGSRNFDYRYCWLRDTSFALDAMLKTGLRPVVHASLSWVLDVSRRTLPRLEVYYALDGKPGVPQHRVDWPGYRGTQPVLAGNSAAGQLQIGGYGDVMETAWLWVRDGNGLDPASGRQLADMASHMCLIWDNADAGIWELGSRLRHYTKSKVDAWLVLDRAVSLADRGAIPGADRALWDRTRTRVARWVDDHCWSPVMRSFRRSGDTEEDLDAAVLLLPRMGFIDGGDARMRDTIEAVRTHLSADGPLLYRFTGADEVEGAFLACSFWLADALARAGDHDGAAEQLEAMLAQANDVGLYSEEIDPSTGEFRGNFPQALTHLTLVNAATAVVEHAGGETRAAAATTP